MHITLRANKWCRDLRRRDAYRVTRRVLELYLELADFRVIHLSIQQNHFHLLVEADSEAVLSRRMRSLVIRLAKQLNVAFGQHGSVFPHRYHARYITSPWQARNALSYVLRGSTRIPIEELPVSAPMSWLMRRVHRQIERSRQDWVYDRLLPDELAWRSVVSSTS